MGKSVREKEILRVGITKYDNEVRENKVIKMGSCGAAWKEEVRSCENRLKETQQERSMERKRGRGEKGREGETGKKNEKRTNYLSLRPRGNKEQILEETLVANGDAGNN